MKKLLWLLEYAAIWLPYTLLRLLPRSWMKCFAVTLGSAMNLVPSLHRLSCANIRCAFPELSETEVRRIAKKSFQNLLWNLTEFIWMHGRQDRIHLCCEMLEKEKTLLADALKHDLRFIYVNPHLGSWEDSAIMSAFFGGVKLTAIAKPLRNPYLNRLFNNGNRENIPNMRIIFAKGAMRAALKALKEGWSIGTLIDQNTRARDGGVFVRFFGLPVPSSTAPAVLKSYCDHHGFPCEILYATSLRNKEGKVIVYTESLSKPFSSYADEKEVLQELMSITERYIRQNPEQYLWMYKRFQYIPPEATPEERKRYPYYADDAPTNFYRKA